MVIFTGISYRSVWAADMYLRYGDAPYRRRIILPAHFCALRFSEPGIRSQAAFQWLSPQIEGRMTGELEVHHSPQPLSALHPLHLYIHPHRKCGRHWNGSLHIRVILRAAACRTAAKATFGSNSTAMARQSRKKRTDLACLIVMKEFITFQVCFWAPANSLD